MAGIGSKVRTIVLSNAHSLLDKVIDMNSIGAVKQGIRDLEESIEDLEEASAQAAGYVRTITREASELEAQANELDHNIDFILGDEDENNDHLAIPLQARLDGINQQLEEKSGEIPESQTVASQLAEAVSNLRAKHAGMVQQLSKLEALDREAKAKEAAATALSRVADLTAQGADVSVDDVTAKIRRRGDVADVKFERAMGSMTDTVDKDVALAQAKATIEERKRKIAEARVSSETPAPATS